MPGRGGGAQDFSKALEESFRAFTLRPENRAIVEAAQREEALQSVEAAEREATRELLAQVEAAGPEVAAALSPFLSTPVLRRIILSFANDAEHGLRFWALNQQAQALLRQAKRALSTKRMTQEELEFLVLQQLKGSPGSKAAFEALTRPAVHVATTQLRDALNEHLEERSKARKASDAAGATEHLQRALSILRLVRGCSAEEQGLIDLNTAATLLELARAQLAAQRYGDAVATCRECLERPPPSHGAPTEDSAREELLLLLARAHTWRRNFKEAQEALGRLQAVRVGAGGGDEEQDDEVHEVLELMRALRQQDRAEEAALCSRMFKSR